jgi:hypothetical protein
MHKYGKIRMRSVKKMTIQRNKSMAPKIKSFFKAGVFLPKVLTGWRNTIPKFRTIAKI